MKRYILFFLIVISIFCNNKKVIAEEKELLTRTCNNSICQFSYNSNFEISNDNHLVTYNGNRNDLVFIKNSDVYNETYYTYLANSTVKPALTTANIDGLEERFNVIYAGYASPIDDSGNFCTASWCDNTTMDDNNKLSLEFNLDIPKDNYNDIRIEIDYLSSNTSSLKSINVVDYNSLRYYIYDMNGQKYGPYMIDDKKYNGLYKIAVGSSTNIYYSDNYNLISENLFNNQNFNAYYNTNCKNNSCTFRVSIVPFDTYHNVLSYFNFKSLSVYGYTDNDTYQKESIKRLSSNIDTIKTRIAYRMFYNGLIEFTPANDFLTYNYNKEYISQRTYKGIPYGFSKISSSEKFISLIDNEGKYTPTFDGNNYVSEYGFSCSTSTMDAISKNIPIYSDIDWTGKIFYSNDFKISECANSITYDGITLESNCHNSVIEAERNNGNITGKSSEDIRALISEQEMYFRYASLNAGDIVAHKELNGGPSGHTRLVTDASTVALKVDSENNYIIDGDKSYVYVTEIDNFNTNTLQEQGITGFQLSNLKNITNYLQKELKVGNLNDWYSNYRATYTQWRVGKKYSFKELYYESKTNNNEVGSEIYLPFTLNTYNEITNKGIEVPYAKLYFVYNNEIIEKTYYDDEIYDINDDFAKKLAETIKNKKQLVGTIKTNYKLVKIKYEITNKNGNIEEIIIYPTYSLNNLENRYSMYNEENLHDKLSNLGNGNNDNISRIKISVLSVGPNIDELVTDKRNEINSANEIVIFDHTYDNQERIEYSRHDNIVKHISVNTKESELIDELSINSIKNVIKNDTRVKTGSFEIKFRNSNDKINLLLSVSGDVEGIGEITKNGASRVAKHIIDKNVISDDIYLIAADYNQDDQIKMNDVIKMLSDIDNNH